MSEKYTPRVGDKVRATLTSDMGETSFTAFVIGTPDAEGIDVRSEGFGREALETYLEFADGWLFEQIVSVPSKFGAVIRRADGVLLSYNDDGLDVTWAVKGQTLWLSTGDATRGGFSVLFDGVDE